MSTLAAIVGGSTLVMALAAAALVAGNGYHSLEGEGCDLALLVPYGGNDAELVQIRIENTGSRLSARICVAEDDKERFDEKIDLGRGDVLVRQVRVSPAAKFVSLEIDRPGGELWNTYSVVGSRGATFDCDAGVMEFNFQANYSRFGSELYGPKRTCALPQGNAGSLQSMGAFVPTTETGGAGGGAVAATVGAITVGGAAVLLYQRRAVRFLSFALFTRLVQPKLLDQATRARIAEAVTADPGVTASNIANRLGLHRGVAQYHLMVLEREEILSCVHTRGFRHYFPLGKFSPDEMQKRGLLRQRNASALYELIKSAPGIGPSEAANRLGIPASRVTQLVSRLTEAGLLDRTRSGRNVRLRAVPRDTK